jgi:DNA-binding transcriptional regulator of glucitol operon
LITNIQAENRGLPIKISLCDAFGSIQSFRYNSEKREFQQEFSKALVTVGGQSFLRTASCQQLLDRDSVDTKNMNNTAYFVFAAPETVERQAKQIDFLRKKSGAVNVVLDQSARIVHF